MPRAGRLPCDVASPEVNVVLGRAARRRRRRRARDRRGDRAGSAAGVHVVARRGRHARPISVTGSNRRGVGFLDEIPGMAMDLADLGAAADRARPARPGSSRSSTRPRWPHSTRCSSKASPRNSSTRRRSRDRRGEPPDCRRDRATASRTGCRRAGSGPVDGRPVTTTRLHTAAGVGRDLRRGDGAAARRRGYGEAITRHVLHAARDAGFRIATLQASPGAAGSTSGSASASATAPAPRMATGAGRAADLSVPPREPAVTGRRTSGDAGSWRR